MTDVMGLPQVYLLVLIFETSTLGSIINFFCHYLLN
jgi:hypothetical protein